MNIMKNILSENIKISKITFFFLVAAGLFFVVLPARIVLADSSSANPENLQLDAVESLSLDDLKKAVSDGGLSSSRDIAAIEDYLSEEAPEEFTLEEEKIETFVLPEKPEPVSLEYLERQGGLSTRPEIDSESPTVFELAATFFERVVFRKKVEFEDAPDFKDGMNISGVPVFDEDTAGYAVIKKGQQSVVVEFDEKYEEPPVVTATISLEKYEDSQLQAAAEDLLLISDVKFIVTKVSKKEFEIMMDRIADSDIPFSWHALAVSKPMIHKKKGTMLKNAVNSLIEGDFWAGQANGDSEPN